MLNTLFKGLRSEPPTAAWVAAAILSAATLCTPNAALAGVMQTDRIERVVDGDTVILSTIGRARLIGVNTPETVSPAQRQRGEPPQCYGPEASAQTKKLLPAGTAVGVEYDVDPTDRFGRTLIYLYRGDDFINADLVRDGYARAKAYKPNIRYKSTFDGLEAEAKAKGKGLWGSCSSGTSSATASTSKGFGEAAADKPAAKPQGPAKTPAERKQREEASAALAASKAASSALVNPGDAVNCSDFATYAEAKAWFDKYYPAFGDVAKLDGDGDGVPCNALQKKASSS